MANMDKTIVNEKRMHVLVAAVLIGLAFVVYRNTLIHEFLLNWDDLEYVVENETIQGITWEHLKDAFTRVYAGNYAPLHIISYMIDYSFWGLRPGAFLFVNVCIHAVNAYLLYFLLVRMDRGKSAGFLAAFIFLFHPVQVESVAWISQRKNLLAMFFSLLSFHLYLSYRRGEVQRRALFYSASVMAFVLALLSKSVAVIQPLVLFLYDLCYVEKADRKKWLVDKLPYLLAAVVAAVITVRSQSPELGGGRMSYDIEGPLSVFYTMLTVLVLYGRLLVWPANLSALYMPPMKYRMDGDVLLSIAIIALLVFTGVLLYRRRRRLFFWFVLFFAGLLPVSQIVSLVTLMNDRYLYFPMMGAAGFYGLMAFPPGGSFQNLRGKIITAALCLVIIPLPFLSWQRTAVWRSDVSLWADASRKTPNAPLVWVNLGMSCVDAGRTEEALSAFLKALSLDPDDKLALNNIGVLYNSRGETAKARPYLLRVVELFPDYYSGLMNLGINYYLAGEFLNAEAAFSRALALNPQAPEAQSWLDKAGKN